MASATVWPAVSRGSARRRPWRRRGHAVAAAAAAFLVVTAAAAVLAPWVAPYSPTRQQIARRLTPPAWVGGDRGYFLGTDQLGRDIASRILYGARVSLGVAVVAVTLAGATGTVLGVVAGYYGGRLERLLTRLADVQLAFPLTLLVITLIALLGPGLLNVIAAMALGGWAGYFRMARAQVLSLREAEYVLAARCVGCPDARIAFRHVLPNALSPLVVLASFSVAQVIILESALSFLGLGVQPPTPTWGAMLADSRDYLAIAWWLAAFPGLALMLTVLAINVLGDWLRDLLDPRLVV
ncbi:MAG: ABC transporter permease [Armatimonadota bacterium]|nr:ABC transporter permease [Armatimonadota bacterium]MDR7534709.1 ABC transporter permease [Armatimonadota bacterium]MDR7534951.1 ABC transporter permease [Armatimonadota bacterium]